TPAGRPTEGSLASRKTNRAPRSASVGRRKPPPSRYEAPDFRRLLGRRRPNSLRPTEGSLTPLKTNRAPRSASVGRRKPPPSGYEAPDFRRLLGRRRPNSLRPTEGSLTPRKTRSHRKTGPRWSARGPPFEKRYRGINSPHVQATHRRQQRGVPQLRFRATAWRRAHRGYLREPYRRTRLRSQR